MLRNLLLKTRSRRSTGRQTAGLCSVVAHLRGIALPGIFIGFFTRREQSVAITGHGDTQMAETQASPSEAPQAQLLVIDDDASICTVIEKLGEKAGFAAKRAVSLEQATQLLRTQQFDCITLDLSIGKNTGIELLGVLAEMACTTPIIIISASMRSMRDFAMTIGTNFNLAVQEPFSKPINFAKLKQALIGVREKMNDRQIMPAA
jgi:CheY-like chemotaxis protein